MGSGKQLWFGCALVCSACAVEVPAQEEAAVLAVSEQALSERKGTACAGSDAIEIDPRRSLVITEQPILERFSFQRVMSQLVSQARVPGLTAKGLFQQWWDTQNPGSEGSTAGHCDAEQDPELGAVLNGFPYSCRPSPAEGAQASCDPFADAACAYIPVGLFNRFDLAPADGSSCGEYRVVFAKAGGASAPRSRNLLIFEASMPNPTPEEGLEGCLPLVRFWSELSRVDNMNERARRLEQLYFRGLESFPAVIDVRNFGDNALDRGQVRTNQFMQEGIEARVWSLREFKLKKECGASSGYGYGPSAKSCALRFVPTTNKTNPYGPLFSESSQHEKAAAFQEMFPTQVASLATDELTAIGMSIPDTFNSAQSQALRNGETNYAAYLEDESALAKAIARELDTLGSPLEPVDIIARAQTQSCAGCHQLSNNAELGAGLVWPASLGFTHVDEVNPEQVGGVTRYRISEALTTTFLPRRKEVMETFLRTRSIRGHRRFGWHTH